MMEVLPVIGIGEVVAGDDLGDTLSQVLAPMQPQNGDVLVVTQKIVSKAEGRMVPLDSVVPGARAVELAAQVKKDPRLVELALGESSAVVRSAPGVLITRHSLGFVMANAGIDCSNIGPDHGDCALLLPLDPDASAARIREALQARFGVKLGVIVSDSFGRPWRHGVTNVAIGASGLPAIHDKRGEEDRDGRVLQVTQIAYGDLLACAAGLVMGEAGEGIPVALVRGCPMPDEDIPAARLVRGTHEDLFQ